MNEIWVSFHFLCFKMIIHLSYSYYNYPYHYTLRMINAVVRENGNTISSEVSQIEVISKCLFSYTNRDAASSLAAGRLRRWKDWLII